MELLLAITDIKLKFLTPTVEWKFEKNLLHFEVLFNWNCKIKENSIGFVRHYTRLIRKNLVWNFIATFKTPLNVSGKESKEISYFLSLPKIRSNIASISRQFFYFLVELIDWNFLSKIKPLFHINNKTEVYCA